MASPSQIFERKIENIPHDKDGLRLWLRLVACTQMVEQEIRAMLREKYAMTLPRFELLAALDRVPDGLTMGELSRWLMVTKGNITGIAERLSEDGYIKRAPTPTDRRSFVVTLTPRGRKLFKEMETEYERLLDELFADISIDDFDSFTGVLARIKEVIEVRREQQGRLG
ncbi:MAG: MarR family transcriptional regulator [Gammaproteobacteria bacterium]|nr:MarR family transcriptional regulator [Gammaproteobacteria bacterium]